MKEKNAREKMICMPPSSQNPVSMADQDKIKGVNKGKDGYGAEGILSRFPSKKIILALNASDVIESHA